MNLIEKIFEAGVIGAGGAGFPTHTKLNAKVEYFIINAAECEPLLHTDKYVMEHFPKEIIKAVEAVGEMICAEKLIIAIKGVNKKEIQILENEIANLSSKVKLFHLDNYYPAGDEQMIVYDVTGRVVPAGGIPLNVSAVVSNVATMLNIYDAMNDAPVVYKYLTVAGEVKNPMVLKVPIGISFQECIDACGGASISDYYAINGGVMMGKVYNQEAIKVAVVTKTTSGIIIVGKNNFIDRMYNTSVSSILNRAKSACIQCSFCTDLCPRQLTGHKLRPHRIMRYMSNQKFDEELIQGDVPNEILEEALICCECGICETYACPMMLSPRQVNVHVKKELAKKGIRYTPKTEPLVVSNVREYRKILPSKIMARMGLSQLYDNKLNGFEELTAAKVSIPTKQHIGAPSSVCVSLNDYVNVGQLIATGEIGKLSANVHASISGFVTNIDDKIEITRSEVN